MHGHVLGREGHAPSARLASTGVYVRHCRHRGGQSSLIVTDACLLSLADNVTPNAKAPSAKHGRRHLQHRVSETRVPEVDQSSADPIRPRPRGSELLRRKEAPRWLREIHLLVLQPHRRWYYTAETPIHW